MQLKLRMVPFADRDQFAVEIYLRPDTPLERTGAVADSVYRALRADDRVLDDLRDIAGHFGDILRIRVLGAQLDERRAPTQRVIHHIRHRPALAILRTDHEIRAHIKAVAHRGEWIIIHWFPLCCPLGKCSRRSLGIFRRTALNVYIPYIRLRWCETIHGTLRSVGFDDVGRGHLVGGDVPQRVEQRHLERTGAIGVDFGDFGRTIIQQRRGKGGDQPIRW